MKAKGRKLDTVYIGGGTPTTLEPEQLKVLLDALMENFCCENLAEFTIEAGRPDSITRERLMMIRNYPITRISVKSTDDESGNAGYYWKTSYSRGNKAGIYACKRVWF